MQDRSTHTTTFCREAFHLAPSLHRPVHTHAPPLPSTAPPCTSRPSCLPCPVHTHAPPVSRLSLPHPCSSVSRPFLSTAVHTHAPPVSRPYIFPPPPRPHPCTSRLSPLPLPSTAPSTPMHLPSSAFLSAKHGAALPPPMLRSTCALTRSSLQ